MIRETNGLMSSIIPTMMHINTNAVMLVMTIWSKTTIIIPSVMITATSIYCSTNMVVLGFVLFRSLRVMSRNPIIKMSSTEWHPIIPCLHVASSDFVKANRRILIICSGIAIMDIR